MKIHFLAMNIWDINYYGIAINVYQEKNIQVIIEYPLLVLMKQQLKY